MANQPRPAVPLVIAPTGRGERVMDVYSSLLQQRIIFLSGMVDDTVANVVIAQLLHLDQTDSRRDVQLLINSPGGVVDAGLAIYDTMRLIRPPVSTTCVGLAASIAAVLLAGRDAGEAHRPPQRPGDDPPGPRGASRAPAPTSTSRPASCCARTPASRASSPRTPGSPWRASPRTSTGTTGWARRRPAPTA